MLKSPAVLQENVVKEFRVLMFKTTSRYAISVEKNGIKFCPKRFFKDKLHATFHFNDQVQAINQTVSLRIPSSSLSSQASTLKSESMSEFLARGGAIIKCISK